MPNLIDGVPGKNFVRSEIDFQIEKIVKKMSTAFAEMNRTADFFSLKLIQFNLQNCKTAIQYNLQICKIGLASRRVFLFMVHSMKLTNVK